MPTRLEGAGPAVGLCADRFGFASSQIHGEPTKPMSCMPPATRPHRWLATGVVVVLLVLATACEWSGRGPEASGQGPAVDEILLLAPPDGAYHAFSSLLARDLSSRLDGRYRIRLVTSTRDGDAISGSMDVLDAMARRTEGPVHYLGLSQSDVAYHFRYGGHPLYEVPHAHRERLSALAKTFPETLHLYSSELPPTGGHKRWEFDDFQGVWESLYLGELGSGTLITIYNVFPIISSRPLGMPAQSLRQVRGVPPSPAEVVHGGARSGERFGAAFVASAWRSSAAELLAARGGTLVSLSASQQRHLVSVYSALYRATRLRRSSDESGEDQDAAAALSIEIPALLITDRALPEAVARAVFAFLAEIDQEPSRPPVQVAGVDRRHTSDERGYLQMAAAMHVYRDERFEDLILPPHRTLLGLASTNFLPPLTLASLFVILLLLLLRRCVRSSLAGVTWLAMPRTLVVGVALTLTLLWFHACLAAVMVLERRAYLAYEVDAPSLFIQRGYIDLLPGLMHYMASGFSMQELIPRSYSAQLVWLSIPFVLALSVLGGTMHLVVPPVVGYLGRVLKGEAVLKTEGHILILHWHPYAIHIIRQLDEHARLEGRERQRFLVVAPDRKEIDIPVVDERTDRGLGAYTLHKTTATGGEADGAIEVAVLERDPRAAESLEAVASDRARFIIVFPVVGHPEPDSATVILLLRLQQVLADRSDSPRPKVLVWAHDPGNVPLLMDERLGADDVCSMEWAWRVLCQSTYVECVSNVYRRLMIDTVDTEELYELVLPDDWLPRSFGSLLKSIWDYNALVAPVVPEVGKRNVVSLVGLAKRDDRRKKDIELCPDPQRSVLGGDRLLIITYKFDESTKARLLSHLSRAAPEVVAASA